MAKNIIILTIGEAVNYDALDYIESKITELMGTLSIEVRYHTDIYINRDEI